MGFRWNVMETIKQAQELADKILIITQSLILAGEDDESDVNAYVRMVEEREPLITKLIELKQSINEEAAASEEFAAVVSTIDSISKLDEEHHDFIENVREAVQGAIKKVKQGRKIHEGYTSLPPEITSRRFDTKH